MNSSSLPTKGARLFIPPLFSHTQSNNNNNKEWQQHRGCDQVCNVQVFSSLPSLLKFHTSYHLQPTSCCLHTLVHFFLHIVRTLWVMVSIHQWNRNIAWRLVLVLYDPVFTRCSLINEGATCKHQVQISFILLFCFLFFCQQPLLFCQAARLEGVMGGGDSQMSTFRETQREWHAHRKNTQDPKC